MCIYEFFLWTTAKLLLQFVWKRRSFRHIRISHILCCTHKVIFQVNTSFKANKKYIFVTDVVESNWIVKCIQENMTWWTRWQNWIYFAPSKRLYISVCWKINISLNWRLHFLYSTSFPVNSKKTIKTKASSQILSSYKYVFLFVIYKISKS